MKTADDITPTARLIEWAVDYLTRHPALRKDTGINLADLATANRVRRKLLKQPKVK